MCTRGVLDFSTRIGGSYSVGGIDRHAGRKLGNGGAPAAGCRKAAPAVGIRCESGSSHPRGGTICRGPPWGMVENLRKRRHHGTSMC